MRRRRRPPRRRGGVPSGSVSSDARPVATGFGSEERPGRGRQSAGHRRRRGAYERARKRRQPCLTTSWATAGRRQTPQVGNACFRRMRGCRLSRRMCSGGVGSVRDNGTMTTAEIALRWVARQTGRSERMKENSWEIDSYPLSAALPMVVVSRISTRSLSHRSGARPIRSGVWSLAQYLHFTYMYGC